MSDYHTNLLGTTSAVPEMAAVIEEGTLSAFDPAFGRPVRPIPAEGSPEFKAMEKLRRFITDTADRMIIPREKEALSIAREMSDALYNPAKAAPRKSIPHERAHPMDPSTVLVNALRQFSNAVFAPSKNDDRPDVFALRELLRQIDCYLAGPSKPDIRRAPLYSFQTLIGRLIEYYG